MTKSNTLPRWDLTPFFPALDSPEFGAHLESVSHSLNDLEAKFDLIDLGKVDAIAAFEDILVLRNRLVDDFRLVNGYISGFTSTDSRNDEAKQYESLFEVEAVRLRKLLKRMTAWIDSLDIEHLLANSSLARDHEFAVRRTRVAAQHMMEPGLEALTSDLEPTGSTAWRKLYSDLTSQLEVVVPSKSGDRKLPMSAVRALAYDADRAVRRDAYHAELDAWRASETMIAAAMNSIKGERGMLSRRRGWAEPLDSVLFTENIDRAALDAMLTAAREAFPTFRRYLKAKARKLGLESLSFYDIFAPLDTSTASWEYGAATRFVEEQFRSYSDRLGDFAERSFRENWIDVEPRPGKRDGAFCMGVRRDESRILLNFKAAFGSVSTLAHELGHGYHNLCLSGRTAWQRETPMTLAETASIFCETIVRHGVMSTGSPAQKLAVLEASLYGSTQVVVDIFSRYLFESRLFAARSKRELSASEMCELMREAQLETYGDGLNPQDLHPYMWAAKPHYYGRDFYNFPYMFGLLFGLGLYAVYERQPDTFRDRYDDLLSSTGLADAATLAQRFDIDIRTPDFWRASLAQIEQDVDRFEMLIST